MAPAPQPTSKIESPLLIPNFFQIQRVYCIQSAFSILPAPLSYPSALRISFNISLPMLVLRLFQIVFQLFIRELLY